MSYTFQESETIGGFRVRDRLACFLLVVFVQIEFRVRDRMALKKKRGKLVFVCKKNLSNFNVSNSSEFFVRYKNFVKTNEFKFL